MSDGPPARDDDPHATAVAFANWSGLFPERVETDRLVLRRLSPETVDLHEFYDVCAHDEAIDEVTEYLTWDPHQHPAETREFVTAMEDAWDDGEAATYVVYPRDADTFAGGCGLRLDWERRTASLGLWLRKRFWGRGYSGERAAALIELAFEHLDCELVAVTHSVGNETSQRAIEKYVERFGGLASAASEASSRAKRSGGGREEAYLRNGAADEAGPIDVRRYTVSRGEYADAVD